MEKRYSNIEEDFLETEKKVLKAGQSFGDERKDFICDFENTFDIQAVPWSGKTTALLAKLVILEENIDRLNWWVLVLSHTNKSVDNIKERLWNLCPQLCNSNYHFIWTIQSFINDFLAKPYYSIKTWNKIQDIDDDIYNNYFSQYRKIIWNLKSDQKNKLSIFLRILNESINYRPSDLKYFKDDVYDWEISNLDGKKLEIKKPRSHIKLPDRTTDQGKAVFENLKKIQYNLLLRWVLRFYDTYWLANKYIEECPIIKIILQKRFKYVYIDEMQDLEGFQIQLIDDIFGDYDKNWEYTTPCKIQRIWDISQCIFHEWSENWIPIREQRKVCSMSWSHRLHQATADVVNYFKYWDTVDIVWHDKEVVTQPTLLIFDKWQEKEVWRWFIEKLKEKWYSTNLNLIDQNKEDQLEKKRYTAVGRTGKNRTKEQTSQGDNKRCLKHYFPNYSKDSNTSTRKSKEYFSSLLGYINNYHPDDRWLVQIRKMILRGIIHQIRAHDDYKKFWISDFLEHLKKHMWEDEYEAFLVKIYGWCRKIQQSQKNESILITIKDEIVGYYNEIIIKYFPWFNQLSGEYVWSELKDKEQKKIETSDSSFIIHDGYYLNIDSVHGAKGQDHEATLYLMTYFHKSDYKYFIDIIKWDKKCSKPRHQQAQKMFYVWFSRAKKWLCYAICREVFDDNDRNLIESRWREIIDF